MADEKIDEIDSTQIIALEGSATNYLISKIHPLRVNQITHYSVCERLLRRHRLIGLALVVFSTFALGTTFADKSIIPNAELVLPAISILVALLSALLAFMGDQARAMDHQSSAVAYGALVRQCEVRTSGACSDAGNQDYLAEFLKEWAAISRTSPLTTDADRQRVETKLIREFGEAE
ncbi:SLATT domain-containing protein [Rhodobacter aestuarii]|uniref:SLATT domain-containing protein n=1 Tax=Rhodobacter aestuarii TaxID=453582 RepID=UPI001115AD2E|nr:SLATT domain-containing protein [Rhodobacter aestuarii]